MEQVRPVRSGREAGRHVARETPGRTEQVDLEVRQEARLHLRTRPHREAALRQSHLPPICKSFRPQILYRSN